MKIVLVGGQNIPGIGGVEAYMLNMAKALFDLGHQVTILCSDRKAYTATIEGIKVVHLTCPRSNSIALPLLFLKSIQYILANRKDIDVVNYQAVFFAFISGWIASLLGCKVCYTVHSLPEDSPKHSKVMKWAMKTMGFVSMWLCANRLLTISNSKAREIKARYHKSSAVIPCGVNMPKQVIHSDILERFGITPNRYYLTIGRIDPIKNLDVLIRAFLEGDHVGHQLVIAGDYANDYGASLRQMAQANKKVVFVGSVMGDDKECLLRYCAANCLVSSSEGMPISLLEAMAYGKPCIVTDIPAIREIVCDDWALWSTVGDVRSLARQMTRFESGDWCSNADVASYVAMHHSWHGIAGQYVQYVSSL